MNEEDPLGEVGPRPLGARRGLVRGVALLDRREGIGGAATITAESHAPTHIVVLTPTTTSARPMTTPVEDEPAAADRQGGATTHLMGEAGVLGGKGPAPSARGICCSCSDSGTRSS